jgi:hypothetical protein
MPYGPKNARPQNRLRRSSLRWLLVDLLMAQERGSSDSSFIIFEFLLFSYSYRNQMNECFAKSSMIIFC